jgi:hypothetical protein
MVVVTDLFYVPGKVTDIWLHEISDFGLQIAD